VIAQPLLLLAFLLLIIAAARQAEERFPVIQKISSAVVCTLLGILLGLAATWAICRFTGWEFLISGLSVASGLGTAAAVGLFFGFQPARQAARLDPIAGLQGK